MRMEYSALLRFLAPPLAHCLGVSSWLSDDRLTDEAARVQILLRGDDDADGDNDAHWHFQCRSGAVPNQDGGTHMPLLIH